MLNVFCFVPINVRSDKLQYLLECTLLWGMYTRTPISFNLSMSFNTSIPALVFNLPSFVSCIILSILSHSLRILHFALGTSIFSGYGAAGKIRYHVH